MGVSFALNLKDLEIRWKWVQYPTGSFTHTYCTPILGDFRYLRPKPNGEPGVTPAQKQTRPRGESTSIHQEQAQIPYEANVLVMVL